jgi:hypothetical protein
VSAILVLLPGLFRVADAALALILRRGYMLWGLEGMPRGYAALIRKPAVLPPRRLLAIKVIELLTDLAHVAVAPRL